MSISLYQHLKPEHQQNLRWFEVHKDKIQSFPGALQEGQFLATRAKGIYKPKGYKYALSIRFQLASPYEDGSMVEIGNGRWVSAYHEEIDRKTPDQSSSLFTNRALLNCMHDKIPIGVLAQVSNVKTPKYKVMGLGMVLDFVDGYFIVCDVESGIEEEPLPLIMRAMSVTRVGRESLTLQHSTDTRVSTLGAILRRQGQGTFRRKLIDYFQGKCAVSKYDSTFGLDAAHIQPYRGVHTNDLHNGLLLRSDLHNLFDFHLLTICPQDMKVGIDRSLMNTQYSKFAGHIVQLKTASDQSAVSRNLIERHHFFSREYHDARRFVWESRLD